MNFSGFNFELFTLSVKLLTQINSSKIQSNNVKLYFFHCLILDIKKASKEIDQSNNDLHGLSKSDTDSKISKPCLGDNRNFRPQIQFSDPKLKK